MASDPGGDPRFRRQSWNTSSIVSTEMVRTGPAVGIVDVAFAPQWAARLPNADPAYRGLSEESSPKAGRRRRTPKRRTEKASASAQRSLREWRNAAEPELRRHPCPAPGATQATRSSTRGPRALRRPAPQADRNGCAAAGAAIGRVAHSPTSTAGAPRRAKGGDRLGGWAPPKQRMAVSEAKRAVSPWSATELAVPPP